MERNVAARVMIVLGAVAADYRLGSQPLRTAPVGGVGATTSSSAGASGNRAPALRRHSVSGFSAGAAVAINHMVAFSEAVDGVGVIGASPCVDCHCL